MGLIGLIVDSKTEKRMKKIVEDLVGKERNTVIIISENSLENIKNIQFETLFIAVNYREKFQEVEILNKLLRKAKYLVINSDENVDFEMCDGIDLVLISYGFNSKCTITASSVSEDEILLCVQRNIRDKVGKMCEIQEIKIKKQRKMSDFDALGLATMAILYGKTEQIT